MKIVHVQIKETGTAMKRRPSTTAGLASGYQRTNITTSGVSVAETTGGFTITEIITLPSINLIPFTEQIQPDTDETRCEKLKEAYETMARENDLLAEDFFPIALEVWPAGED
jgi:hypothetical protein